MNENVENLILTQLREIRGELSDLKQDVAEIKSDMSDVNQKVDGITLVLTMLAGHVSHVEERVTALEDAPSK